MYETSPLLPRSEKPTVSVSGLFSWVLFALSAVTLLVNWQRTVPPCVCHCPQLLAPDWSQSNFTAPWPGHTYLIVERATGKALTLSGRDVTVEVMNNEVDQGNHWAVVNYRGYLAFYEHRSGRFLGDDGHFSMRGTVTDPDMGECFVAMQRPDMAYSLMQPLNKFDMRTLTVKEDERHLVTRPFGETGWDFVQVAV